ncbi:hypothetical protein J6590_036413 [Homalodisca vitripennis]|nr:hypothetical protein J6590_036413 [Homalodisca vitripennis]
MRERDKSIGLDYIPAQPQPPASLCCVGISWAGQGCHAPNCQERYKAAANLNKLNSHPLLFLRQSDFGHPKQYSTNRALNGGYRTGYTADSLNIGEGMISLSYTNCQSNAAFCYTIYIFVMTSMSARDCWWEGGESVRLAQQYRGRWLRAARVLQIAMLPNTTGHTADSGFLVSCLYKPSFVVMEAKRKPCYDECLVYQKGQATLRDDTTQGNDRESIELTRTVAAGIGNSSPPRLPLFCCHLAPSIDVNIIVRMRARPMTSADSPALAGALLPELGAYIPFVSLTDHTKQ